MRASRDLGGGTGVSGMGPGDVRWKLWAEAFRSWFPIVISVCAISLTIFQAAASRRHTRLSVQPRVEWRLQMEDYAGTIVLSLANVGFGPAVMSEVGFRIDGDLVPADGYDACLDVARRIGRDDERLWDIQCFAHDTEYVLRPGDTLTIFGSRPVPEHASEDHAAALVDYRRFGVAVHYCSFYEDCWDLSDDAG